MSDCLNCSTCVNCDRGGSSDRLPSLFDSVGPIMTGSSSSATAGVLRIGRMGRVLIGGTPEKIDLHFYGALSMTYKGHATDSAIVAGLLGELEDSPLIPNALKIARSRGISVQNHVEPQSQRNPMTVDMELTRNGVGHRIAGISIGGGEIEMTEVDGNSVQLHGNEDGALFSAEKQYTVDELSQLLNCHVESVESVPKNGQYFHCLQSEKALSQEAMTRLNRISSKVYPLVSLWDFKLRNSVPLFETFDEMIKLAQKSTLPALSEEYEMRRSGVSREWVRDKMRGVWKAMVESVNKGITGDNHLFGALVAPDDGARLAERVKEGKSLSGNVVGMAVARALAVMENNGSLCRVVAAPTAGSCGIVPGALMTSAEQLHAGEDQIIDALLAAAMTGVLIAKRAPVSGALGGCQSEIGVSSSMAAAGLAQLGGGTPKQVAHAMALALKNILGLICDPVAGPVEIPCIKRNAIGVANAFAAADMALADIESVIPPDEVVDALINTQRLLPRELRGTLNGGLASTPTAHRLKDVWYKRLEELSKEG